MKKVKKTIQHLIEDESGQGATEYILIMVIVVAVVVMFGGQFREQLNSAVSSLGSQIQSAVSFGNQ